MAFTTALTKHVPFSSPFLRDAGYINGAWTAGGATKTFDVLNPATGEVLASLPDMGAAETQRSDRCRLCRAAGLGRAPGQGTCRHPAQMVRPDGRQCRRAGCDPDRRNGQAFRGGPRRDPLRRGLCRVVRGGSQAHLWRNDPGAVERQAHDRHQAAGRRRRHDHALEFSGSDDHPQDRAGASRRLRGCLQAGRADAAVGDWRLQFLPSRPAFRPASSMSSSAKTARRSARNSAATRRCARSASPARPRLAAF